MMNNLNFEDLSLYLEEEFQYKMVKFISHRELHTEYFEIYFRIFDSSNVYSEFIDSEDYKQWLIKRKRIENINKII